MQHLDIYYETIAFDLLENMRRAETIPEMTQMVVDRLNKLIGPGGSFSADLTAREQHIVTAFFNSVLNILFLLRKIEIKSKPQIIEDATVTGEEYPVRLDSMTVAAAASVGAALVPGVLPAVVAGLVAGSAAMLVTRQVFGTKSHENTLTNPNKVDFDLVLDPEGLQASLMAVVSNFDRLVDEIEEVRKETEQANIKPPCSIEALPNVLPFFHEMLGFKQDLEELGDAIPEAVASLRKYLKIMPKILRTNGIDIVSYQEQSNDQFFDLQSTFREPIDALRQLKPALVKGDKPLLKGLVAVPDRMMAGRTSISPVFKAPE